MKMILAPSTNSQGSSLTSTCWDGVGIPVTSAVMLGCCPAPPFALLQLPCTPLCIQYPLQSLPACMILLPLCQPLAV